MKFAFRGRVALLATCTACLILAGALPVPAFGSGAVPHCSTGQLRMKAFPLSAATGHRFIDFAFRNAAPSSCSLRGYPRGVLLDKRGHVIHLASAKVGRWKLSKVRTVVIAPGKRAFFSLMWLDGGFCPGHSFTFYGIRISPPANAKGLAHHIGITPTCDSSAVLSAVRPKLTTF